ncbi:hypothetical protein [Dietzia aurantiaca]|uniref:Uncharacterized protein n=1 Tax=Dietzia aurantiaca TaxID=983873 RepID=A0ABV9PUF8_9ACTN
MHVGLVTGCGDRDVIRLVWVPQCDSGLQLWVRVVVLRKKCIIDLEGAVQSVELRKVAFRLRGLLFQVAGVASEVTGTGPIDQSSMLVEEVGVRAARLFRRNRGIGDVLGQCILVEGREERTGDN